MDAAKIVVLGSAMVLAFPGETHCDCTLHSRGMHFLLKAAMVDETRLAGIIKEAKLPVVEKWRTVGAYVGAEYMSMKVNNHAVMPC